MQAVKDMEKVLDVSISQIVEEETTTPPNRQTYPLFSTKFFRRHGRDLFSCSLNWFLVDVVFYSSNLFQSQIYHHYIENENHVSTYEETFKVARLQAIVAICSTIPGYFVTVYFIDRIGRVKIQLLGFFFMGIVYMAIGVPYKFYWGKHVNIGFMFLYGLTFFFANFGPNTTTFIVPAELFPARFRSTCHGISGAIGKVGAIVGSVGFLWASKYSDEEGSPGATGMTIALMILGGVCVLGMLVTYFFTKETMGRSLEENENEDEIEDFCFLRCISDSTFRTNSSRRSTRHDTASTSGSQGTSSSVNM